MKTQNLFNSSKRRAQLSFLVPFLIRVKPKKVLCLPGKLGWDIDFFVRHECVEQVICIEKDKIIYEELRTQIKDKVTLVNEDLLSFLYSSSVDDIDMFYLDMCGPLSSYTREVIKLIFVKKPDAIIFINLMSGRTPLSEQLFSEAEMLDIFGEKDKSLIIPSFIFRVAEKINKMPNTVEKISYSSKGSSTRYTTYKIDFSSNKFSPVRCITTVGYQRTVPIVAEKKLRELYPNFSDLIPTKMDLISQNISPTTGLPYVSRYLLSDRIKKGIQKRKDRGGRVGRKPRLDHNYILELRKNGFSMGQIGKVVRCGKATVSRVCKKAGTQHAQA